MHEEIERLLDESLADNKLDKLEKAEFRNILGKLTEDERRYMRNQAFDKAREKLKLFAQFSEESMRIMNWLERIVKLIDNSTGKKEVKSRAYFSPSEDCRDAIINLLDQAKSRIDICVFTISDNQITSAIKSAHDRGITVRVLSDNDKANDRGSDVYHLEEYGVPVTMDTSPSHMHHKFALVDNYLINGSFNWTRSATDRNQENIVVSDHPELLGSFDEVFNQLWKKFS